MVYFVSIFCFVVLVYLLHNYDFNASESTREWYHAFLYWNACFFFCTVLPFNGFINVVVVGTLAVLVSGITFIIRKEKLYLECCLGYSVGVVTMALLSLLIGR